MIDRDLRRKRQRLEAAESRYLRAKAEAERADTTSSAQHDDVTALQDQLLRTQEDYQQARSQKIIREARRLELPVPEINDSDGTWERGRTFQGRFLTDQGVSQLRAVIRAERRERYESWSRWVVLTIGLIGAATGLAAVISTLF